MAYERPFYMIVQLTLPKIAPIEVWEYGYNTDLRMLAINHPANDDEFNVLVGLDLTDAKSNEQYAIATFPGEDEIMWPMAVVKELGYQRAITILDGLGQLYHFSSHALMAVEAMMKCRFYSKESDMLTAIQSAKPCTLDSLDNQCDLIDSVYFIGPGNVFLEQVRFAASRWTGAMHEVDLIAHIPMSKDVFDTLDTDACKKFWLVTTKDGIGLVENVHYTKTVNSGTGWRRVDERADVWFRFLWTKYGGVPKYEPERDRIITDMGKHVLAAIVSGDPAKHGCVENANFQAWREAVVRTLIEKFNVGEKR